jgi:phosphinothricin acetyltransferase
MVRIRLAREADAGAIAAIYAPFVERTAVSFETKPPDGTEMARRIGDTTARYPWLVCELDGHVAGYAYATQHRVRAAYRWSVDTAVYIDAVQRRRGIGRGLYASLSEILKAQGFFNAYAGITLPNDASVGLHQAVGFTIVGVYKRVGFKFGEWHDVGWWHLIVQAHIASPDEPLPLLTILNDRRWDGLVESGERIIRASVGSNDASGSS